LLIIESLYPRVRGYIVREVVQPARLIYSSWQASSQVRIGGSTSTHEVSTTASSSSSSCNTLPAEIPTFAALLPVVDALLVLVVPERNHPCHGFLGVPNALRLANGTRVAFDGDT
jgi:hypothetical protein